MKPADLRAIVERMTYAPWYPRGRFLSLVTNSSGVGGTLHTNHIANFAEPADAAGCAALRNHADAVLALVEAVRVWRGAQCDTQSCETDDYTIACAADECAGDTHAEACPVEVARQAVLAAHDAIEVLP